MCRPLLRPAAQLAAVLAASASWAGGGVVYGTVTTGQAPVSGLTVVMACPSFATPGTSRPAAESSATTDGRGGFTLLVRNSSPGRCQIRARQGGRDGAPTDVFVSGSSLKYDFVLDSGLGLRVR